MEMGLNVGYFKPVGYGKRVIDEKLRDTDVILMKDAMNLSESVDILCPVVLGNRFLDQITGGCEKASQKIQEAHDVVKHNKDVLLIESAARPESLTFCNLNVPKLAEKFNANILFSVKGDDDTVVDKALHYRDYTQWEGGKMLGVVINFVPFQQIERMKGIIAPMFKNYDLEVLGIVPDKRELTLPTVQDVMDILDADVLTCSNKLEGLVDNYLVGAMSPESALSWLRRSMGRAFITGGDRADLILTALETKPSAIILTGNIYPSVRVLSTAEAKGVPILLVPTDTYTTVTKLELLDARAPTSMKRIQLTRQIMGENINWRKILDGYIAQKKGTPD
jgi:BioD-like phosphotransacetylase family protein